MPSLRGHHKNPYTTNVCFDASTTLNGISRATQHEKETSDQTDIPYRERVKNYSAGNTVSPSVFHWGDLDVQRLPTTQAGTKLDDLGKHPDEKRSKRHKQLAENIYFELSTWHWLKKFPRSCCTRDEEVACISATFRDSISPSHGSLAWRKRRRRSAPTGSVNAA